MTFRPGVPRWTSCQRRQRRSRSSAAATLPGRWCLGGARCCQDSPGGARVEGLWRILAPLLGSTPTIRRAWREDIAGLVARAAHLDAHGFSAIRFRGGGTDLTVGLLDRAHWTSCAMNTNWGHRIVINLPTEEVFTTPDYRRTEGVVRVTRPIELMAGGRVEELVLRFEKGRATEVRATRGAKLVRAQMAGDAGAAFLGEVALVDGSSPGTDRNRVSQPPDRRECHEPHRVGRRIRLIVPTCPRCRGTKSARIQPVRHPPGRDDRRAGCRRPRDHQ